MVIDKPMMSLVSESGKHCVPCSPQILSDMLLAIHTMEMCDILIIIICSKISLILC